jgi:hypothetical protein
MNRPLLLLVFFGFFVAGPALLPGAGPQKLSREELAQRQQEAGEDPIRLLQLCPLAEERAAEQLRGLAAKLLIQVPRAERAELARKVAVVLADAAPAPDQVRQVLGPPQKVSRQIVYRRCMEQWTYVDVLPLYVTWTILHGENAHLEGVRPTSQEKQ